MSSALGQTRTIRACQLHVCFTPKTGRSGAPAELAGKGQQQKWSPGLVGAFLRTIVVRPVAGLVGADRARASMESRGSAVTRRVRRVEFPEVKNKLR